MRPNLHPRLVNGRFGDPGLFVEMLHRKGAILFDLGDLSALSARDLLRVSHVFVTHTHMDHFVGFDALLRVHVGREKTIRMVGPAGFAERVGHKLLAYEWDLVDRYEADLVFEVAELDEGGRTRAARFRFKRGFAREDLPDGEAAGGVVAQGDGFAVRAAVLEGRGDEWPVETPAGTEPLGALRGLVSVSAGQKVAYVTDVADTPANRSAIGALAEGADTLFLEARFAAEDEAQARARAHLTTRAAGEIARGAGVRRLEPFHFSPRYEGEEERMLAEVRAAFTGGSRG